MEEREYQSTYQALNQRRCVYEKAINARRCSCEQAARFHLADREGVACKSDEGNQMCTELLDTMRRNARFSLHLTHANGPLPHAKEIRVQVGGLLGLQQLLHPESSGADKVSNIHGLAREALDRYTRFRDLPYDVIVKAIVSYQGRRKHRRPEK